MKRLMRRRGFAPRIASAALTLVFLVAMTGAGYATPAPVGVPEGSEGAVVTIPEGEAPADVGESEDGEEIKEPAELPAVPVLPGDSGGGESGDVPQSLPTDSVGAPVIPEGDAGEEFVIPGYLHVFKYRDNDHSGDYSDGDVPVEGVSISAQYWFGIPMGEVYTETTGSDGWAHFTLPLVGFYTVTEDVEDGWVCTDGPSQIVWCGYFSRNHGCVDFGNYPEYVTKTFELHAPGCPDPSAEVRYWTEVDFDMDGIADLISPDMTKVSDGVFSTSVEVAHGAELAAKWYVEYGGIAYPLGFTYDEDLVLDENTNELWYESSVSGIKYQEPDLYSPVGSGDPVVGVPIVLYRFTEAIPVDVDLVPDPGGIAIEYASTTTNASGNYEFTGVLPGHYMVAEDVSEPWIPTEWPTGMFEVSYETPTWSCLDFGNFLAEPSLLVDKYNTPPWAVVGDTVTYRIYVENDGNVDLVDVHITDPMFGLDETVDLAIGAWEEYTFDYTIAPEDRDGLDNLAEATGWFFYDGIEMEVYAEDALHIDVIAPELTVVKTSDAPAGGVEEGTEVTYTYVVTNTGNVRLHDLTIDDDKIADPIAGAAELMPGDSFTRTASAVLTETTTNVVTVEGWWDPPVNGLKEEAAELQYDPVPQKVTATAELTVETFLPFTEEEDFLPFTGGDLGLLLAFAMGAGLLGVAVRSRARKDA